MAPGTLSDPFVAAAFWTGAGALLLTVLLSLRILLLRMSLRRNERREAQAFAKWRPLLHGAVVGEMPGSLPPLTERELRPFLKLWVHLQASLRGEANDALNDIARRLEVAPRARAMLDRRQRSEQLLATLALGHLHDTAAREHLREMAGQPDKTLALTALWALVRIDPRAAAEYVTPLFVERDDWALSRVAGILQQASAPAGEALLRILPGLEPSRLPRALRIAEALRVTLPAGVLDHALRDQPVPVLVAALRSVTTPAVAGAVRALLAHANWEVRVQAAKALGRIGSREDIEHLAVLLGDREWWVRYRAAQALAELAALYRLDLATLRASLADRFAVDILGQVMAEKEAA